MGSLFSQKPNRKNEVQNANLNADPISYAENALLKSGGDPKAAFYMAAKEKGIDPDQFLKQISSLGDSRSMLQNLIMSNPRARQLMSLFSAVK